MSSLPRSLTVGCQLSLALLLLLLCERSASAQIRRPPSKLTTRTPQKTERPKSRIKTEVSFELYSDRRSPRLASQQWGQTFQRLGINARIRPGGDSRKPSLKEDKRGTLRWVTVVGKIDSTGAAVFTNRRFRLADAVKLRDWIQELKTYGVQGKPNSKEGFGLSTAQLSRVFSTLEAPIKGDWEDLNFPEAIKKLDLPATLPLRFSGAAQQYLTSHLPRWKTPAELAGFSKGTALAIVLNNAGLGFRPGRTPEGELELVAVPLTEDQGVWPIGWPLTKGPVNIVPKLVELVPVELDEVPLPDVLMAASISTKVPIIVDTYRPARANISLEKIIVNQKLKKMTWSGLLDRATFPKLMREQLTDEAGKPFVWITTRTVKQLNERNKQREAQFARSKK